MDRDVEVAAQESVFDLLREEAAPELGSQRHVLDAVTRSRDDDDLAVDSVGLRELGGNPAALPQS